MTSRLGKLPTLTLPRVVYLQPWTPDLATVDTEVKCFCDIACWETKWDICLLANLWIHADCPAVPLNITSNSETAEYRNAARASSERYCTLSSERRCKGKGGDVNVAPTRHYMSRCTVWCICIIREVHLIAHRLYKDKITPECL
ncbi:hypothetical protein J6590_020945 [Homalodisca vitripennis]|nr:hypothetical protein J6590_020945 [Homalodisca vitripennis]